MENTNDNRFLKFIEEEGINQELIDGVKEYLAEYPEESGYADRIPDPEYYFYGKEIWEEALSAMLCGKNLLLAGPKATGKNVFCGNLAALFRRPAWNVSFHIGSDAASLIGTDTFDGQKVVFREGPITLAAKHGGFAILDEINMARNEALAVLHSTLDYRRSIDVPGYDQIKIAPAARFIGTMNYGYAGTRELNEALCSRFAILEMPVISEADLSRLLRRSFPDLTDAMLEQFTALFYELDRKAEKAEISDRALDLRGLLDAIDMMKRGTTSGDALDMCITNKTFDPYERTLIRDVLKARIPQDLTKDVIFK